MAICKFCAELMTWGQDANGRFVPLIPLGEEGEHDRDYQDENGVLRSTHRQMCTNRNAPLVKVVKLARSVKSTEVLPSIGDHVSEVLERKKKRKVSRK